MWKVTVTTHNLVLLHAMGAKRYCPETKVRIFRSRLLANWYAFWVSVPVPVPVPVFRSAIVERYYPNANVVPLRKTS